MNVCQLAPCLTDDCPLTGRCRRPYPWRRTPAAVFAMVNPGNDPTIYSEIPPEDREKPKGRRMVPYDCADATPAPPTQTTLPGL